MLEKIVKNKLLKSLEKIHCGEIQLTTPEGDCFYFKASNPGRSVDLILKDWRVIANLNRKGDVGLAEDYRDEFWDTQNLTDLLSFGLENECIFQSYQGNALYNLVAKLGYFTKRNSIKQSKKNIYAHYDLGNQFYELWLDESMTYSSAIYHQATDGLYDAQQNKYDRILQKIPPGASILEVGCGWGGFAEKALQTNKHTIKGITISQQQHQYAKERLAPYGNLATIALEDYRHQQGQYDAIVSIEMIEAVGQKYWPIYFKKLKSLLKPKGKIIIQSILIADPLFKQYVKGTDMIRTHIFPGGMLPSRQILYEYLKKENLRCIDDYTFGLNYAKTLMQWLENFVQQEEELIELGFDKRFQRMWKFYLASCIAAFQQKRIDVVQLEINHA